MSAPERTFKVRMSERCFRFKPDALPSHAPDKPGVYEFVTFDAAGKGIVLYVGLAQSVFRSLSDHLSNKAEPTAEKLFAAAKDVYFDYVADADIDGIDDLKDIAGALIAKNRPRFNTGAAPTSGKYSSVTVEELD